MTTITLPRAVVEQALEVINDTAYGAPVFRQEVRDTITALRAALAQQDEPVEESVEPVEPVDVGLLEYRGNSVAFIHQKMTAYRAGIDVAWDAFRAKGLHPDGKTSLADMIAKHTAPPQQAEPVEPVAEARYDGTLRWLEPHGVGLHRIQGPLYTAPLQRKPLTDEEIDALPWNGSPRQFARAVERALEEKNRGR